MLTIKSTLNKQMRKFKFAETSFAKLAEKVRQVHAMEANDNIALAYVDSDGDLITFDTDHELAELFESGETLRLVVNGNLEQQFKVQYPALDGFDSSVASVADEEYERVERNVQNETQEQVQTAVSKKEPQNERIINMESLSETQSLAWSEREIPIIHETSENSQSSPNQPNLAKDFEALFVHMQPFITQFLAHLSTAIETGVRQAAQVSKAGIEQAQAVSSSSFNNARDAAHREAKKASKRAESEARKLEKEMKKACRVLRTEGSRIAGTIPNIVDQISASSSASGTAARNAAQKQFSTSFGTSWNMQTEEEKPIIDENEKSRKYAKENATLVGMGFGNVQLNFILLEQFGGNLEKVVGIMSDE